MALICAKLALIPVIFDYTADVPFTVVKALASHAFAYVLAGVLAGLFVQFGPSIFVRSWMHVPIIAFLAANIVAALFAADSFLALYGAHERMLGLGTVTDEVLLYFAVVCLVRTRRDAIALATSVMAGSLVVLGYETIQFARRDPLSWATDSAIRPFSTMGNTTSLAEYLTVVAVAGAAVAALHAALPRLVRVLLALYSVLALAGAVVTQTRSVVFGILAGSVLLITLTWASHPNRRVRVGSMIGAAGAIVGLALVLLLTPLGARLFGTVEFSGAAEGDAGPRLEGAADTRAALYRISIEMVRDRPAFGYGPDNFLAALAKYRSDHEPYEVQDVPNSSAHSWMAQVAMTSGVLGLSAFVAIPVVGLVLTIRHGFRPESWTALAMLGAFLGEGITTINAVATDQLFWLATGIVAAINAGRPAPAEATDSRRMPRTRGEYASWLGGSSRSAIAFLTVGLGLVLAAATLNALSASHFAKASLVARVQGHSQQAVDSGLQAVHSDPMRAQYWETLGLAYISADRLREALPALERASKLAPYDVRYGGDHARALAELAQRGDGSAAAQARSVAERVVRTDPNNPLALHTRAYVMQVTGNLPEALKSVERALALDRLNSVGATNRPEMYVTGIQVLTALERPREAIALAGTAIAIVPDPKTRIPIRIELSRALAANGQLTEALAEIEGVLALQPSQPAAQQLRAQILAALSN